MTENMERNSDKRLESIRDRGRIKELLNGANFLWIFSHTTISADVVLVCCLLLLMMTVSNTVVYC